MRNGSHVQQKNAKMFKQLTLDGIMNDETQDKPKIMEKNMKNYFRIQKNEDNSISNIGNEYY